MRVRHAGVGELILLWLGGISLRITILAVPPLLPTIHRSLHLSESSVGALTNLPVLLLAVAAIPGSLLIARIGARRALIAGLTLVAIAGAARGIGGSEAVLFAMTFLMGVGIAVSQPALPSLVRLWFAHSPGLASAVYANGSLVGEIVAASFTLPLVYPLLGRSWEAGLAFWSIPVFGAVLALAVLTPHVPRTGELPAWWPAWRDGRLWALGLTLGAASAAYFGSNAFLPDYLKSLNDGAVITAALVSLSLSQLPSSFIVAAAPNRFIGKRWPVVVAGALTIAGAIGYGVWPEGVVAWAGIVGFSTAVIFVLVLALPPTISSPENVHGLTSGIFTVSYVCPFVASVAGGSIWDATGISYTSFLPVIVCGIVIAGLSSGFEIPDAAALQNAPLSR